MSLFTCLLKVFIEVGINLYFVDLLLFATGAPIAAGLSVKLGDQSHFLGEPDKRFLKHLA